MEDSEDGTLRFCQACAEETPHEQVQYGEEKVPICELCGSRYQKRVYDLPEFKEKN
jgi:hypothetical protein